MPLDKAPAPAERLNPIFEIDGEKLALVTQYASVIQRNALSAPKYSLRSDHTLILGALDMLISDY